jgi:cytochrome P450
MSVQVPLTYSSSNTRQLPHAKEIDALPLLHAVVKESLRLRPTVPVGQPRLTPHGTTTLGGYGGIPENVQVNAFAWSIHRNPEMFPCPEQWKPERWLVNDNIDKGDGDDSKDRWFWAFGSGPRM